MEPYSQEFRGEVLAACDAGGGTRDVAVRFNVSESWVRRINQQRRETGQIAPKTASRRQPQWHVWADWYWRSSRRGPIFIYANCKPT